MEDAMDFEVIKRLLAALEREHVRYAIFGAVAMALHGLARFTEDLDLFVEPEAANIDGLRAALRSVIDDQEISQLRGDEQARVATGRRPCPCSRHRVGLGLRPPSAAADVSGWRPEVQVHCGDEGVLAHPERIIGHRDG